MADIKIPVSANLKGVTDDLDKIPGKAEQVANRLKKSKWVLFDLKQFEADLKKAEQLAARFQRTYGTGVGGVSGAGAPPQATPGAAPVPGGQPTPAQRRTRGRGAYTRAPEIYDVAQNFASGVGGGFSQVASYGSRGMFAGAREGGFFGGASGLMKGLGVGALAYGALKLGQGVSEGYDFAKERAGSLDNIKRQLGDLGISFQQLKNSSESAAAGLGLTSKESAKLMEEFSKASRGSDTSPRGLADSTRLAVGVSRAYGLDPSVGVGFFGGMKNIDRKQNDRELMVMLADTIQRSGMNARADEVMQSIQSFVASTSRMSLSSANLPAYASAYGSLMSGRVPGMTGDVASSILAQANQSVMHMGNAGEAGQNFTLTALSRYGMLDPVQAQALAEGGLFGTRRSVFSNKALAGYLGAPGADGPNADVTNFHALREAFNSMGGPKSLTLDAVKKYFGVSSLSQGAALLGMNDKEEGNLKRALDVLGIKPDELTPSGIQKMAAIGGTASREELLAAAKEGRQETEYTKMLDAMKSIEEMQAKVGDKLVGPVTDIRNAVMYVAEKVFRYKPQETAPQTGGASGSWSTGGASGSWDDGGSKGSGVFDKKGLLKSLEQKYGLAPGLLNGVWGAESSFGANTGPSSAGALGHFQFMPGTAKRYGVKFGDFASEAEGAARYLADLYRQKGNWKDSLYAYNGVVNNVAAGDDYIRKVMQYGNVSSDITQMPASHANGGTSRAGSSQQISINGSFTLNDPRGNPLAAPLISRMTVPRSSGSF